MSLNPPLGPSPGHPAFAQLPLPTALLSWVFASIALYALTTITASVLLRWKGPRGRLPALAEKPVVRLAIWLVWMIWLILPAYAAVLLGDLSPRLMGLSQIDLGAGLGKGALFAAFSLAALLSAGLIYRRGVTVGRPYHSYGHALLLSTGLILEAGALQWHWAFYRTAVILALAGAGLRSPGYWGSWMAVGLICVEGALSPFLWRALRTPGLAERRILRGVLLFATTVIYLLSRNFWLAWALHAVAIVILEPRLASRDGSRGTLVQRIGIAGNE